MTSHFAVTNSCARSLVNDVLAVPDAPIRSKQRIIAGAILRVEPPRSDPHPALHLPELRLLDWKRYLYLDHDPIPVRGHRKLGRLDSSHSERHWHINNGIPIWVVQAMFGDGTWSESQHTKRSG